MQISGWKRAVVGILATIFLGALGSGLWDIAIKPGGYWIGHSVLTLTSFGSKTLKDQVYLAAAKGNHEEESQFSNVILSGGIGVLCGALLSAGGGVLKRKQRDADAADQKDPNHRANRAKLRRVFALYCLMLALLTFVFFSLETLRINAANQAYTYFRQSLDICRPYISDRQAQLFQSRFASIRTRDEFIDVTNDLRQIAQSNHLRLPDFKPW